MEKTLSLGASYLGLLSSQLHNLRGYATLANELIQNADDAPGATQIVFRVCDDALIVENNGYFTDCGNMESRECPWLSKPGQRHRCDFHRFRLTASGDKRREAETTGAFGIGFIAVYQITDRPELISSGRHWVIRPEMPENDRILVREPLDVPGTRFKLPWATNPESQLRVDLGVESITRASIDALLAELRRSLPSALLFLRKLTRIELWHDNLLVKEMQRIKQGNQILIQEKDEDGTRDTIWYLFGSDFQSEAERIRLQASSHIERKRSHDVVVAIPESAATTGSFQGLFHAYLPTHHQIGLPLHVNADFYPSSDRKRILFEGGYQGKWNWEAVQAAARAVAGALPKLPKLLGHEGLWRLLHDMRELAREAANGTKDPVLGAFWQQAEPQMRQASLVRTTRGHWRKVNQVRLLQDRREEEPCLPILEGLGLEIVHLDLNRYLSLLRELGTPVLDAEELACALEAGGLRGTMRLSKAPKWIQADKNRELLSAEIKVLLGRKSARTSLASCSIACSMDGWLCPPSSLRRAVPEVIAVFGHLQLQATFSGKNPAAIDDLVPDFGVSDAIGLLEGQEPDKLSAMWKSDPNRLLDLLAWFADRSAQVRLELDHVARLRRLHIWPSGEALCSLETLVMPGGFEDPLQLAKIIDTRVVRRCGDFLRQELHVGELTFEAYASEHVPQAFRSGLPVSVDARRRLAAILAKHLGELRSSLTAQQALSACPIVECADGQFRLPAVVYFEGDLVTAILSSTVPIALLPAEDKDAVAALWRWLGVASVPRPNEIVRRVADLTSAPPDKRRRALVQQAFSQVGLQWTYAYREQHADFSRLQQMAWLPASGNRKEWFSPRRIYAVFSRYLFASQADFLDVPTPQQQASTKFMEFLGVPDKPSTSQVVHHLLQAAKKKEPVNKEVYTWLNNNADDPAILLLQNTPCLLLEGDQYVRPEQVFWGDHPFGRYRYRLGELFLSYGRLLERLKVKKSPEPEDAILVLREIRAEFAASHVPLDPSTSRILLQCWTMLSTALEQETLDPKSLVELRRLESILDVRDMITPPEQMYFEDRPGLKEKFLRLEHNVIPRPEGAWLAMQAAGVRPLSQAVRIRLEQCLDEMPRDDVRERLQERRALIARVLAARRDGNWNQALLKELEVRCASRLVLTHTVNTFFGVLSAAAEEAAAYLDVDEAVLYFVDGGDMPWSPIARELAYALNPLGEAGQVAAGLKEVLSADSPESAERELSELGFAPLQVVEGTVPSDGDTVAPGGTDDTEEEVDYHPKLGGGGEEALEGEGQGGETGDGTGHKPEGGDQPPRQPGTGDGTGKKPKRKKKMQGRLGTYVQLVDESEEDTVRDGSDSDVNRRVDDAGVARVVVFEKKAGRTPRVMPHGNPGYDIEALDEYGEIARYIEVKSSQDEWGKRGVGLTHTQFRKAQEEGKRYWLYIVERAESELAQIHRIQDPANKVNLFFYDDGWRAVALLEEQLQAESPQEATSRRRSILDVKKK